MTWEYEFLTGLQNLHTPILDKIVVAVTSLGNGGAVWIILGILLLFSRKTRPAGVVVLIALILDLISCNFLLKNLIARDRPCWVYPEVELLISRPEEFSFPSGHTASSFAAAAAVYLYHKKWGIAALILAAAIAFTRLYLFVHWPTDILGGILLGIGCAYAARFLYNVWNQRRQTVK